MEFKGASIYDQKDFFTNFMKRRGRKDSPTNAIEKPIIFELIDDVQNKAILDLGCGDATFGKELLQKGAAAYIGVDGSTQMVSVARKNIQKDKGQIIHEPLESYSFPLNQFDIVTSRMVVHYISDIDQLFLASI